MAEPKRDSSRWRHYRNPSVTDYSVNSNPLGVPEAVRKSVQESADRIMYYPDVRCDRLRESISDFERIEKEKILCGNGAAEHFFCCCNGSETEKSTGDGTSIFPSMSGHLAQLEQRYNITD